MEDNGWIFDNLTNEMALCMPFKSNVPEVCGGNLGWYGWGCGSKKGSISTVLRGSGTAQLHYGNCWNDGKVDVFLNGTKIVPSDADSTQVSSFDYRDGEKLEIMEVGAGIIQIRKMTFKCKGNEMSSLIFTTWLKSLELL